MSLRVNDADPYRSKVSVPWHWLVLWGCAWSVDRGIVREAEVTASETLERVYDLGSCSIEYACIVGSVLGEVVNPETGMVIR